MELSKTGPVAQKYGLILGLALTAFQMVIFTAGLFTNQALGYLSWVILIGLLIVAIKAYKDENEGFMTFGKGVGVGALTSIIGAVIVTLVVFIYIQFVDPGIIDQMVDMSIEKAAEMNPTLDDEALEQARGMTEKFILPGIIGGSLLGTAIMGTIFSLIISAIMKNDPPKAA